MQTSITFNILDLTEEEWAVWSVLRSHRGQGGAIKKVQLARLCGLPEREMRNVIKDLIQTHHLPIGSTSKPPYGYFIIETPDEAAEVCEREYRRALSVLYKIKCLRNISARELAGQIKIDLEVSQ